MAFRGDRLKHHRTRLKLSQEELAYKLGVGVRQIYRYENGENDPTADIVARLAKLLELSADYLLGLTDRPQGELTFNDLSPDEQELIITLRRGRDMRGGPNPSLKPS